MVWVLVSLVALLLVFSALVSPKWLVAPTKEAKVGNTTLTYTASRGIYTRCKLVKDEFYCSTIAVRGLATDSDVFPIAWKTAMVFISLGLTVMCLTVVSGIMSFCFQSIFKKSIFTMSGATQAFAGLFYILGVMLYPMAWGTARVQNLCGKDASPFYPGECSLGWGLWSAVIGTALTFLSACLSVPAEQSTSSDKVQDQIHEGHTLICLA